jgi:hypothetical protein
MKRATPAPAGAQPTVIVPEVYAAPSAAAATSQDPDRRRPTCSTAEGTES